MRIEPKRLRHSFDQFLQTDAGTNWLANVGFPGWLLLIAGGIQMIGGWCAVCTIILFPSGVRWIYSGMTFRAYRESLRKQLNGQVDELEILPACGIIVGPTGAALFLACRSSVEMEQLARLAGRFGELYASGSSAGQPELWKLLHDDAYQPNRRRRVPSRYSQGLELLLLDVRAEGTAGSYGGALVQVVAMTPGDKGVHAVLPWSEFEGRFAQEKVSDTDEVWFNEDHDDESDDGDTIVEQLDEPRSRSSDNDAFDFADASGGSDSGFPRDKSSSETSWLEELANSTGESTSHAATEKTAKSSPSRASRVSKSPSALGEPTSQQPEKPFLTSAAEVVAVISLGILLTILFPALAGWIFVAYVVGAVVLLAAAWILAFRHAWHEQRIHAVLFVLPWHFVRYAISNLPQTRAALVAVGLFLTWISAPLIVGLPIQTIAGLLNAPIAGPIAQPQQLDPPAVAEAVPKDPMAVPVQLHRESRNGGPSVTTVTWSDQTQSTYRRPALAPALTWSHEQFRKNHELSQRLRRADIGDVVSGEVFGHDLAFVYGGESGVYTLESEPGAAALHAGLVNAHEATNVQLTVIASPKRFPMIEQNGVISFPANSSHDGKAYRIGRAPATD